MNLQCAPWFFATPQAPPAQDLAGTGAGGRGHWSKCNGKRVPMPTGEKLLPSCFPNIDAEHPPFCRWFFRTGHHGFSTSFWNSLPWGRCLNRYNIGICLIMFNPCLPTLADESSFSFQRHCGKARINSLYCFLWEFIKSYRFMKISSTCKTYQEIVGNHRLYPDFRADNIFAALIQNWKPATCPLPWLTTPGRMWIYSVWGSPFGLLLEKVGSMINKHCTP